MSISSWGDRIRLANILATGHTSGYQTLKMWSPWLNTVLTAMVAVTEYLTWEKECFILINICRPQTPQLLALLILGKGRNRLAWQWEHGEGDCSLHGTQEAKKQETGDSEHKVQETDFFHLGPTSWKASRTSQMSASSWGPSVQHTRLRGTFQIQTLALKNGISNVVSLIFRCH